MELPAGLLEKAEENMKGLDVEGFVLGEGNPEADIMLVGEAPGEKEAVEGTPFIGRAGDELDKQLDYLGLKREDIYITSAVRSRPYKWVDTKAKKHKNGRRKANRKPNQKEIKAHAPILDYQIKKVDPKVIIALGGVALERLAGKEYKISQRLGEVIKTPVLTLENDEFKPTKKEYAVFPLYHPAAIFYNPSIRDDIYTSLDRLKDYLNKKNI
ncbi:uracil-DNA glycosylase [Halobacillus massiliensis]|uniref:uracil-DNA glycosylase n=1 Tax=Halobacillus massiliensis TaxID=1926286 RepID=UPI0009E1ACA4|nr:uracil-DNA glycosylase [Halobacillus massiliensis]